MEAPTRTAAMGQAAPVKTGKETKVLITTREKGTNLIGTELMSTIISQHQYTKMSTLTARFLIKHLAVFPDECEIRKEEKKEKNIVQLIVQKNVRISELSFLKPLLSF